MKSTTHPWGLTLLFVTALAAAGCEKKTASNVVIAETAGDQVTKNIVVHDPHFAKNVKILDLRVRRERDLLEGFVIVQNQTDETVPFEYRVEWFDADQVQIETPITSWKPVTLDGHMNKTLRELSPRTEAVSFKFFVRAPNAIEP